MRKISDKELNKILRDHKLWLDTGGDEGNRAKLKRTYLRKADLQGKSLLLANFQKADLRGADLRKTDLRGIYLRKAKLREAILQGADLRGADLRKTDLRGASLCGGNLWGADLAGADLKGAKLQGTNLQGVSLWRANLRGANLRGASLRGANLSKVQSLWNCIGNGKEIKNIKLNSNRYKICYTSNLLQIGCCLFKISEWEKFSDNDISGFDIDNPQAGLAWWKENKDEIFQTIKEDPAE